ncbi:MAG TPA: 4Fe-4S dicluster domain-containing protein [Caulobacteraceae bacterium]|jgi:molybdopterin-containing oxidoreductase family iron-sulfur binding subunit
MRTRAEFETAFEALGDAARRDVLKVMGAALAMSGLSACEGEPDPRAIPYVTAPENLIPGKPRFYATAVTFGGYAQPVIGTTYDGRPTKLEGLPNHPMSGGTTDAFTQGQVLDLYDPARSQTVRRDGRPASWALFEAAMVDNARRLDARQGEGLRLLTGATSSPTFARELKALTDRWPMARWHVFEPVHEDGALEATRIAFGRPLSMRLQLDKAEAVVCLDADLLGPGPHQTARGQAWAKARLAFQQGSGRSHLLVIEPAPTQTGVMAQDRLAAGHARIGQLTQALAAACGLGHATVALSPRETDWIGKAAALLQAAPGKALVVAGPQQPPEVQALALQLSARLGAIGQTLILTEPVLLQPPDGPTSFAALTRDLLAGKVDTLAIFGCNPVYGCPADLAFAPALAKARTVVHAGLHLDETAAFAQWHAPLSHALESWGDARAVDGRPSLIQPLVRPLYDTRTIPVLLEALQGRPGAADRDLVMQTWRLAWGDGFDDRWKTTLPKGFVDEPLPAADAQAGALPAIAVPPDGGLEILFRPDASAWDGAFANNAWLQELPKPFSTLTWDNVVEISPALAKEKGVQNGDVVRVTSGQRAIEGPAWIMAGQDRGTVVVRLGYGRRLPGGLADQIGYDAYPLRLSSSPWRVTGDLARAGKRHKLAPVQPVTEAELADFVRTAPADQARTVKRAKTVSPSFYPDKPQAPPQWGMSIDLDLCIGCNACVIACQAENNVPSVGKGQVLQGRHMHWLRVDQYREGPDEAPDMAFQPTPCMHCEEAPCELGCPVNATSHSAEGLNQQVYNRCIGTRTCSSYCPYKVRRFNWFDYTGKDSPQVQAVRNPDVTVRSRGVMEKCSYCLQRINEARIKAELEGRPIRDGEIKTACQQACPTQAIVFGDVSHPDTAVSRRKIQARDYVTLEEADTRPRTSYLARLKSEGA